MRVNGTADNATSVHVVWTQPALYTGPTNYTVHAVDQDTEKHVSSCLVQG
jgi:hypothetical protein